MDGPHAFGAELRRRRLAAGWSLRDLADRLHYSKGYLSKLETGMKPAGVDVARRCDDILGAAGRLRGLAESTRRAAAPARMQPEDAWTLALSAHAGEVRLAGSASGVFGWSAAGPGLAAAAADDGVVEAYAAVLRALRDLGQRQPPAAVLPALVVQMQLLGALAGAAPPPRRRALLALAARFAEYTGWMFQESGDHRAMAWWTARAVQLADAAGDASLTAYADVRRANVAMHRDDGVSTIELASRAILRLPVTAPARLHRLARHRLAQGLAQFGEAAATERVLREARELPDDGPGDPGYGAWTVGDQGALVRGWCQHELGRHDEAAELLAQHLARVPASARRARARTGARLALTLAAAGTTEAACTVARDAVEDASAVDSDTVRHDLRALRHLLVSRSGRSRPEVAELLPRLTEVLRAPAAVAVG